MNNNTRIVRVMLDAQEVSEAFIRFACLVKGIDRDRVTSGEAMLVIRAPKPDDHEIHQVRVEMQIQQ